MQHPLYNQKFPVIHHIKAKVLINVQFPVVTTENYKTLFLIIPVIFTSSSP